MPQSIDQSTLRVSLTSIQLGSWSPTTTPITVILDSTLPYFYLPGDIVENLVQHLGLQYDDATDLYLVNDTQRTNNKNSINTVTLIFNDLTNGDISSSVALSYAAFDLVATFPIYDNATAYFPIRKAQNGNNILGRVLFQESYVFANYEQRNFSIVQATFEDRAPQPNLIPIYSNNFNPTPPGSSKSSGIGGGAIAGIVIGVIAALAIAAGLFWWFFWRKRRQRALKKELKQREFEETEAERRRRETMTSVGSGTMVTDEGTMVSHELDTLSPTDGRPGHSRHLSELSSDSEVTRVGQKPRTSAIYELEAGGDVAAWEQNAQRVNEPQAQAQERSPTPTSPLRMSQVPSDLGESPTSPLRTTQIPSDLGEREREREGHRES